MQTIPSPKDSARSSDADSPAVGASAARRRSWRVALIALAAAAALAAYGWLGRGDTSTAHVTVAVDTGTVALRALSNGASLLDSQRLYQQAPLRHVRAKARRYVDSVRPFVAKGGASADASMRGKAS
jgi:hypothetical protein